MATPRHERMTFLLVSQVYPPDPTSVGQHMADVARELTRRGHRVVVFTGREGYDDPSLRFPAREIRDGVDVRRLPFTSFGKRSFALRMVGALSFAVQAAVRGLLVRRLSGIVFSTTPPMIGAVGALLARLRRVPGAYWVMDLNPDQLVALGAIGPRSLPARVLERANRFALRRAATVIALDRFMAERLVRKGVRRDRVRVIPPWPHEDAVEPVDPAENPFVREHGLEGKFVVMYSGNHTSSNPLATLLEAIPHFADRDDIVFMFVGGGTGKAAVAEHVERHGLGNVRLLPYQPLESIRYSLSAAHLHVATMGDPMVGVIHPSKVYSAMAVRRPLLYIGPKPSHISDLLAETPFGWHVEHGDVQGAISALEEASAGADATGERGVRGGALLARRLSQAARCGEFCDTVESMTRVGRSRRAVRSEPVSRTVVKNSRGA